MASPTQQTRVWESSGSWWRTGKPDVLRSMGSQQLRHDWATELTGWSINNSLFFCQTWTLYKWIHTMYTEIFLCTSNQYFVRLLYIIAYNWNPLIFFAVWYSSMSQFIHLTVKSVSNFFLIKVFTLFFCCWTVWFAVLVLQPGTKPGPPAVEAWSPHHWTAKEFPQIFITIDKVGIKIPFHWSCCKYVSFSGFVKA